MGIKRDLKNTHSVIVPFLILHHHEEEISQKPLDPWYSHWSPGIAPNIRVFHMYEKCSKTLSYYSLPKGKESGSFSNPLLAHCGYWKIVWKAFKRINSKLECCCKLYFDNIAFLFHKYKLVKKVYRKLILLNLTRMFSIQL